MKLQDFFLYPDLNDYSSSVSPDDRRLISGSRVFDTIREAPKCLLTGAERSGKTAFARNLILDLHGRGYLPVYLEPRHLGRRITRDTVIKAVDKAIRKQYVDLSYDIVSQVYSENLVIVIDDFDLLYETGIRPKSVCDCLEAIFPKLVIFASDELVLCESHSVDGDFGGFTGYNKYQICEFGQLRIEALAKKWVELDSGNESLDLGQIAKQVKKVTKQIQNVLSADVIPHHPWILIVLIQQSVDADTMLVRNGSYGHMYQAIVTAALTRSKLSTLELTGKFTYLAALAYRIFQENEESISDRDARQFHQEHCKRVDIPLDYDATITDFVNAGVLRSDDNGVRIVSRYAICFFLAWHLNSHLHEDWAKEKVKDLCTKLYDSVAANTLLFLSHLNSNPFVIDTIREAASTIFADADLANFMEDVEELNKLGSMSTKINLPNSDPEKNREEFIENKEKKGSLAVSDSAQELQMVAIADPTEREGAYVKKMHEIQSAYKMIRILGQILKNGADSLDSDRKIAIVHEVFRLSRRMLGSGFEELKDVEVWREVTAIRIRQRSNKKRKEEKPGNYLRSRDSVEKLSIKADREIIGICWVACFTVVKLVSEAVGAKILASTFEKVVREDPAIPNQLYQLDVLMEHTDDFPFKEAMSLMKELQGNPFTTVLFKSLVAHHFYLYKAKYDLKQKVCDRLGIGLAARKKSLNPDRKKKRLPGPPTQQERRPRKS